VTYFTMAFFTRGSPFFTARTPSPAPTITPQTVLLPKLLPLKFWVTRYPTLSRQKPAVDQKVSHDDEE